MMNEKIIALIDAIVADKLEQGIAAIELPAPKRGLRGPKGTRGRDFSFEENKQDIQDIINKFVSDSYEVLRLKFEDLSEEDRESLRGAKGSRGKDGKNFIFAEHEEAIKAQLDTIIEATRDSLRLKFEDLSEEEVESLKVKGPRGQRGKGFKFEEHREEITSILFNLYEETKEDFKLKFNDLTEEEKQELKLTFSDLTEEEIASLKVKGTRGQRGRQGIEGKSAYNLWQEEGNEGEVKDFLTSLIGAKGEKGDTVIGPRGVPGIQGVQGRVGPQGEDGQDAPFITDIEIDQTNNDFSFIFYFNDGSKIETEPATLPSVERFFTQYISRSIINGGGSLTVYEDGVELGEAENLDFNSEDFVLDYNAGTKTLNIEAVDPEPDCIEVLDEGVTVTDCVKSIDFIGDNVQVVAETTVGDWVALSDIDPLTEELVNPGNIKVLVETQDFAKFLFDEGVCTEAITAGRYITVVDAAAGTIAYAQYDDADKAWVEGVALTDGAIGESIQYLLIGKYDKINTITRNRPIFLSTDGQGQATAPSNGYISVVGKSRGSTSIFFNPEEPIYTGTP